MPRRLLVVEDEIHIQRLIQMILEKKDFVLTFANNGEEGLKIINGDPSFDAVLLDIMMPGIDGLQVLRAIKDNSATKHVPVIMLTALAQENVVLQGVKLGAKDYIRKPFHPQEIVDRINKVLESIVKNAS
jgi:DNA-binding response OmpR family regulator